MRVPSVVPPSRWAGWAGGAAGAQGPRLVAAARQPLPSIYGLPHRAPPACPLPAAVTDMAAPGVLMITTNCSATNHYRVSA